MADVRVDLLAGCWVGTSGAKLAEQLAVKMAAQMGSAKVER